MPSLWHGSWKSVRQRLGICATATSNCSSHPYRCPPSALVLSMWSRLASTNVFEHYKPSLPTGQAIYQLLLHRYEIQCSSLGGTPSQSVYWGCIIQCILFIRGPLAVELTATEDSMSSAVLIPMTKKKTLCCVLGLFTNVSRLALLSTVHSGR